MLKFNYSNKLEILYEELKENLFSLKKPFEKRFIVVPTPAIKSFLMMQMAEDKDLQASIGVEIIQLDDLFKKTSLPKENLTFCQGHLHLAFLIEEILRKKLKSPLNTPLEEKIWLPLFSYLKISHSTKILPLRSEKRLVDLSLHLANLFFEYSKQGKKIFAFFESQKDNWQVIIWQEIFEKNGWTLPFLHEDYTIKNIKNCTIHLFSVGFLSLVQQEWLHKLSQYHSLFYYLLSPCQSFWTDLLSEKESQKLQNYWKNQNIKNEVQEDLKDFLGNTNKLLANFGKMGRKLQETLELYPAETYENYFLPQSILKQVEYEPWITDDFHFYSSNTHLSLLEAIQTDILLLKNPAEKDPIFIEDEGSIQIHIAPSKKREVEILYHNLLQIIEKDSISPSDILVMAPDIADYAPFIFQVFGNTTSLIDFHVMDLKSFQNDKIATEFLYFINLSFSKWDIENILTVLNFKSFKKIYTFSNEEQLTIKKWLKETGISWGQTSLHRSQIFKASYNKELFKPAELGTWNEGINRLNLSLLAGEGDDTSIYIEWSERELLAKFTLLLESVKVDLAILNSKKSATYRQWCQTLEELLDKYFKEHSNYFLEGLETIKQASFTHTEMVPFIAFKKYLEAVLQGQQKMYHDHHAHTTRFCSLIPMRTIPAKVIALLGMGESSFPRIARPDSLNLLKKYEDVIYTPSKTDYDRYLFLETLISCKNTFLISYTSQNNDGSEESLSTTVKELLDYIDSAYFFKKTLVISHPYESYHADYFQKNSSLKKYGKKDLSLAHLHYLTTKKNPHQFIENFSILEKEEAKCKELIISIQELKSAIENPLKTYFNNSLAIYLQKEETLLKDDHLSLSPLHLHEIKQMALRMSPEEILKQMRIKSLLPSAPFKEISEDTIYKEVEKYKKNLNQFDITQVFTIAMHDSYDQLSWEKDKLLLPALSLKITDHLNVKIEGKLENVSIKGLLESIDSKSDPIKIWVRYLIFCYIIDSYDLKFSKDILCLKDGKSKTLCIENSEKSLIEIVEYFLFVQKQPSPLTKEWLKNILFDNEEELKKSIEDSFDNTFKPLYNSYLEWTHRIQKPSSKDILENWQEKALELYANLYEQW